MIHLAGPQDTAEYEAALALRDAIVAQWPAIATDPIHQLFVIASAQCHGQAVRDIDVLVIGTLGPGLRYDTFLPFTDSAGYTHTPPGVEVRTLCISFEVKDLPPERVRFIGTRAEVRYPEGWKDATEQSFRQSHSVRRYLRGHGMPEPFVTGLLWLRSVPGTDLPSRPHNMLGSRPTWEFILNVVAQSRRPRREGGGRYYLRCLDSALDAASLVRAAELFTRVVEPTRLDRKRVERLQSSVDLAPITSRLGKSLMVLRGRGGTGKTMRLLQVAHHLSETRGERVLLLTYNRALVADVRRLLTIVGMKDELAGGTIHIRTVHSFIYSVLARLGMVDGDEKGFLERYEPLKNEALDYLRAGAVAPDDLERHVIADPLTFGWGAVLVDEGQDWPDNERELLYRIFGPERIVVADGLEQMVRTSTSADWRAGVPSQMVRVIALRRSLRMKASLTRFATAVAGALGLLQHEWIPNEEMPGGRVIVLQGSYFADRRMHDELVGQAIADGNRPVDILFCLPPEEGGAHPADQLSAWGAKFWDGTRDNVREGYPTSAEQLRLVRYESCRGLEGWTAVSLGLDRFFAHRLRLAESANSGDPDRARMEAARWAMIPLTRAIDTLVVQIEDVASPFAQALRRAADQCGEAVEWIEVPCAGPGGCE